HPSIHPSFLAVRRGDGLMAVISPRRALVAAVSLCLLLGAATSIRTATFSPSQ
ncbi:hypothetical protein ACJX0J_021617, partial [Zea mays]